MEETYGSRIQAQIHHHPLARRSASPGANFSLHDLAADEIHDLVDAYLRCWLGPLYDAEEAAQKERVLKKEDEEEEGIEKRQLPPEVQLVLWPEDTVKLMESDPSMKLEVPPFILEDRSYIITVGDLTTKDKKIASAIKTLRGSARQRHGTDGSSGHARKKKSSQTTCSHCPPPPPRTHIPPASPSQLEDERPGRTSRPAGQPTHSQCPPPPPATCTHVHPASPSQSEDERTGRTAHPVGRLASHPARSHPPPPPPPPPCTHIRPASPAQSEVEDVPLHVPRNSTTGPVHPVNCPSCMHSDWPRPATTTVHESNDKPHRCRPRPANPPLCRVDKRRCPQATYSGSKEVEQEPSKCVRSAGESLQHLERGRLGSRQHTYKDSGFYSSSTDHH
ncbi:hypothetical protein HYDPIDRAFT_27984 [Hydnomerulius pinastri MD-312]|uniref:Uncharacterized protein n=1 Tax=Hydnomerulius pinastri MD-312 TaxID=994086 RepID=A0A0C9WFY9_9AGAM|nr:hypothetical protein HYDPIDRAFT_27984 [Hydnomerulius pinastri MD-312]